MKSFRIHTLCGVASLALLVAAAPARAGIVTEVEADNTSVNNTLATAQAVATSSFTLPVPADVFDPPGYATATIEGFGGQNDVDFYSFSALAGNILIDVDNDNTGSFFPLSTVLSLFDSTGMLIAYSTDDHGDPGSTSQFSTDSFIGTFVLPSSGTYFLAVSTIGNNPLSVLTLSAQLAQLTRPDGGPGGYAVTNAPNGADFSFTGDQPDPSTPYRVSISVESLPVQGVPEPATVSALASGLLLIGASRLAARRRASQVS